MIKAGIYVHIPFCLKKCAYCDFLSQSPKPGEIDSYLNALLLEIERYKVEGETLFIGGGTPSVVPPSSLNKLITQLKRAYGPFKESTVEINPNSVDRAYLETLLSCGIDRLSIGVQSFNDQTLKFMGRLHTSKEAIETIKLAREVGFRNISIDLIYGYPNTDLDSIEETLNIAVSLPLTHISFYGLQIEEGTYLFNQIQINHLNNLSDEEYLKMYYRGIEILEKYDFKQYEISNFAKEGFECKHNLIYWQNKEYLGLGVGAFSRLGKARFQNTVSLTEYIDKVRLGKKERIISIDERLTKEIYLKENIMLGLRLKEGLGPEELFGQDLRELYPDVVDTLLEEGLLEQLSFETDKSQSRYRLSKRALFVSNAIIERFF